MNNSTRKIFILSMLGFLTGVLLLGVLRYFGLPTFDTFLTVVFGEGNIWAIIFSLALIILIVFGIFRNINKTEES